MIEEKSDATQPKQFAYDPCDEPVHVAEPAPPPLTGKESGGDNRGHRAAVTASGEVTGSGASAGGKGGPEDYDSDPQAGGGAFEVRHEGKPNKGGDASQHGST